MDLKGEVLEGGERTIRKPSSCTQTPKSGGELRMRIENIERLNPLFVRADVEIGDTYFENVIVAKRKGHYAVILLEGPQSYEIPVPQGLNEQLNPHFGLYEVEREGTH